MRSSLAHISKELNIPSEELINRGILAYLGHEIRLAEEDIAEIRDKYFVASKIQLKKKINNKKIFSHPAWEDLIAWENLEGHIKKLKNAIKRIG